MFLRFGDLCEVINYKMNTISVYVIDFEIWILNRRACGDKGLYPDAAVSPESDHWQGARWRRGARCLEQSGYLRARSNQWGVDIQP